LLAPAGQVVRRPHVGRPNAACARWCDSGPTRLAALAGIGVAPSSPIRLPGAGQPLSWSPGSTFGQEPTAHECHAA
jgi:hypothetical protein